MNPSRYITYLFSLLVAIVFCCLTLASILIDCEEIKVPRIDEYIEEMPRNARAEEIKTIEESIQYLENNYRMTDDYIVVKSIDNFIRTKLDHGYSKYSYCENWISYLSSFIWSNLQNPVDPRWIIRYRIAGCSQQGLLFQHLLKIYRIEFTSVGISDPNHFAIGAKLDNRWYYFDTDLEPRNTKLVPLDEFLQGQHARKIYWKSYGLRIERAGQEGRIWTMNENRYPAPEGYAFQLVASILSAWGWAASSLLTAGLFIRARALPRR